MSIEGTLHDSGRYFLFLSYPAPCFDCLKRVRSEPVSDVIEACPEEGF